MKTSRLFEIIYILLDRKKVTANELSHHFEVSIRTIYRDIDTLSSAGIPIYMIQGKNGGISLVDNFVLDKSMLSSEEQKEIKIALQSIQATHYPEVEKLLAKMNLFLKGDETPWIEIEFNHWDNDNEKFQLLKTATIYKQIIHFQYHNNCGEQSNREVVPLKLWFKERHWYLKAYCLEKENYRLFKLSRIKRLSKTNKTFNKPIPLDTSLINFNENRINTTTVKLKIHHSQANRVYDEFPEKSIVKEKDAYIVSLSYPEDEWLYGYILSFGNYAKVMEPYYMQKIIKERLITALKNYI
ncbi:putative DNA-binding transcriptional regulator YafY [Natranaerovirga hydrolytica]|uniref:Putative DNA-binding transcriptional regulator YafY n=1 Tax=Natranaerovirga hydrolytica TaxID=680378 RepID=A0A4R1MKU6_9FIRM|nr:YafY family protein [Natranaerovirga hydrolytica]TCK92452.1 putative DNA-binding transcriptional regulator YafY [Natranaerovirga hydrolytica]